MELARTRAPLRRNRVLVAAGVVAALAGLAVAIAVVLSHRGPSYAKFLAKAQVYTRCMRAHGLAHFPEPILSSSGVEIRTPAWAEKSPAYPGAERACIGLLPSGGGG